MKLKLLYLASFLFTTVVVNGQTTLEEIVTVQYDGVSLEYALEDLEEVYGLRFTYSRDFIPLNQKVSVFVVNEPLSVALDELFAYTQIIYLQIGKQIALKIDQQKELSLLFEVEEKRRQQRDEVLISRYPVVPEVEPQTTTETVITVEDTTQMVTAEEPMDSITEAAPTVIVLSSPTEASAESDQTLADLLFSKEYDFSHGIKGLVNVESTDLDGLQFAVFANAHRGELYGSQVAGLANVNLNYVEGVQAAGLFNRAERMNGLQLSSLGNVAGGDFRGVQLSTLFNVNQATTRGAQITTAFNYSRDSVTVQISNGVNFSGQNVGIQFGGLNIARTVKKAQIGIVNVGDEIKGLQFGIINIADTVSGVPIGLINLVRKGYNLVELAYQPSGLQANLALKFGTRRFYNILMVGATKQDVFNRPAGSDPLDAWGLGYGIGSTIPFGQSRWQSNVELTAAHINEGEFWLDKLNLLTQFKLTLDVRLGRRTSLFAGPQLNLLISDLYDAENRTGGSQLAHAPFLNDTNTQSQRTHQMWWGWSAGIRF